MDGQVFHGDAVAEAGEHVTERGDPALVRHPQHQLLVVARALGQRPGGRLQRGGVGEAQQDVRAGDALLEFLRRALGDDAAPVQHGDAVGELVGLLQVLRGQQDGHAVGDQLPDKLPRRVAAARVQAGRGLVEEDQPWPPHQRHRDVEAALHAAGVGGRGPRRRVGEVEQIKQPGGPRPSLGRRDVQQAAHEEQVLLAGEPVVDRGELPGDPDGGAYRPGLAAHVVPHDAGRAGVRRDQGGQDLHRGGLARAIGPEQREDLTLPDAEVDPVQDDLVAVGLAQAVRGDRVIGRCVHGTHARTLTLGQGQARFPVRRVPGPGTRRPSSGTAGRCTRSGPRTPC